jgi:hypothetical protein
VSDNGVRSGYSEESDGFGDMMFVIGGLHSRYSAQRAVYVGRHCLLFLYRRSARVGDLVGIGFTSHDVLGDRSAPRDSVSA